MKLDQNALNSAIRQLGLHKEAFAPPAPPPMDPSMAVGAPMPPMPPTDPSMMGGAPPMDPSMMGAPMPPMDPSMMPPMDPSMMGGAMPPMPEELSATPEAGGEMVTLSMDDLKAILAEAVAGKDGGEPEEAPVDPEDELADEAALDAEVPGQGLTTDERLDNIEQMMASLMQALGAMPPESPEPMAIAEPGEEEALPPPELPTAIGAATEGAPTDMASILNEGLSDEAQKVARDANWFRAEEKKNSADLLSRLRSLGMSRS